MALGWVTDINHLGRIVLAQNGKKVVNIEDSVVVSEDKPADSREREAERLHSNAGDSKARRMASGIGVTETRGVFGDDDGRKRIISFLWRNLLFEPDVTTHLRRLPP